jgi:hypothetical protein
LSSSSMTDMPMNPAPSTKADFCCEVVVVIVLKWRSSWHKQKTEELG